MVPPLTTFLTVLSVRMTWGLLTTSHALSILGPPTAAAWAKRAATTWCSSCPSASAARRKRSLTTQDITPLPAIVRSISALRTWTGILRKHLIHRVRSIWIVMLIAVLYITSEALANVNSPVVTFPPYHSHPSFSAAGPSQIGRGQAMNATVSPQSLHPNMRSWEYRSSSAYPSPPREDSFMSWEPTRRSTEWSQSPGL